VQPYPAEDEIDSSWQDPAWGQYKQRGTVLGMPIMVSCCLQLLSIVLGRNVYCLALAHVLKPPYVCAHHADWPPLCIMHSGARGVSIAVVTLECTLNMHSLHELLPACLPACLHACRRTSVWARMQCSRWFMWSPTC
jgi:hypothetical protein